MGSLLGRGEVLEPVTPRQASALTPAMAQGLDVPTFLEPAAIGETSLTREGGGGKGRVLNRETYFIFPSHIWVCFSTQFSWPD